MKNSVLKLSLLIVYCSILGNKLLAQNPVGSNPSATSTSSIPNIMSPEAAGLGKYGTYDVNLYTGSPNISLPLHEINENGVKIPITLSYDASGFIPNKNAGIVGLNWNLFAGGAITRVVNGVPDEMLNDPNSVSATGEQNGYIFGQVEKQLGSYTSNDFLTTSFLKPSNCFRMPGAANCATPTVQYNEPGYNFTWVANYELEPDVFSFNFLGHSGKFFLGNDGNVKVSGDRKYKVDLSKISLKDPNGDYTNDWRLLLGSITDPNFLNSAPLSQITITADDGYEFTFGGAFKNIEVQFNYISAVDRGIEPTSGVINAWNLTRVKTPEGKLIFFNNYEYNIDDAKVIYRLFEIQTGFFDNIPVNFLEVKIFENEHKQEYSNVWRNNSQPYVARISKSLIKHCYLKEIVTALQTVTFNYEAKDLVNKFFPNNEAVGSTAYTNNTDKYCTNKLNSIEINDNINNSGAFDLYQPYPTYKKITFNYSNKPGNRSNRLFLDGLNINGTGSSATGLNYSFAYTKTTPADLPDPITKGIDIWGYYNGNDNNITLVGGLNTINTSNYEINISDPGNDRRVNSANPGIALNGILKSITYPTGGKTEFTFENHDCGQILKRTIAGTNLPAPEWETPINNLTVGGLRIKEIKNTPGTTTTYKYVLDYENNQSSTSSSGLLTKSEAFVKYYLDIWASYKDVFSNNIANATTYGESHIGYKEVIEINGEGFTKYEFSNQQSNPDTYVLNDPSGGPAYKLTPEHTTTDYNKQMLRLFKYSSREDERGKITKKSFFKNLATIPIKSIEYVYNNDINRLNECAYGMYFPDFLYSRNQDSDPDKTLLWVFIGLIHPYALYYYHNLPSQMIEKDYGTNSSTPLVTTTNYLYQSILIHVCILNQLPKVTVL